jgi:hypothetical protein
MIVAKNTLVLRLQKLINGLETYCNNRTLVLNGVAVKCNVLVQQLQSLLDLLQQVETTREAWQRAVAAAKPVTTNADASIVQVKAYATATFGVGSEAYVALGFAPPRKRQATIASKVHGLVQRTATRAARNTMGRKQKLAIRAMVPVQAISLVPTTPPVISEPASPSPAATGSSSTPSSPSPSSPPSGNGTPQR